MSKLNENYTILHDSYEKGKELFEEKNYQYSLDLLKDCKNKILSSIKKQFKFKTEGEEEKLDTKMLQAINFGYAAGDSIKDISLACDNFKEIIRKESKFFYSDWDIKTLEEKTCVIEGLNKYQQDLLILLIDTVLLIKLSEIKISKIEDFNEQIIYFTVLFFIIGIIIIILNF